MVLNEIKTLAADLELQELEAPSGVATSEVYEKLLAVYLYENDLCNAKYLWKRIPQSIKTTNPELANIWQVGQHMWTKDYPGIYKALNTVTWSECVADIMRQVQDKIRSRAVDLISQAYTSIKLETVLAMTGLSPDVCISACLENGWKVDADTGIVHPIKSVTENSGQTSSEDQLYKLTDFVSFLEN